jgi:hypothetical protein
MLATRSNIQHINGGVFAKVASYRKEYSAILDYARSKNYELPSIRRRALDNDYIKSLINSGLWSNRDLIYIFCSETKNFGKINWKNPSLYPATYVNTITHTKYGVSGDGSTSYIDTGYNNQGSSLVGVSNVTITCWCNDEAQGTGVLFGTTSSTTSTSRGETRISPRSGADVATYAAFDSINGTAETVSNSLSKGYWTLRKTSGSNNLSIYRNGVNIATVSDNVNAASSPWLYSIKVLATNSTLDAPLSFETRTVANLFVGSFISTTLARKDYGLWFKYYNTIN